MKVINFEAPTLNAQPADTLDKLWFEAEQIGRVSVEHKLFGDKYQATIQFNRRSGTSIHARYEHSNAAFALAGAINEAREMGGGVEQ